MARRRTISFDLPPHTTRIKGTGVLRYRRPDNRRDVLLGALSEDRGIAMANALNTAFGTKSPGGSRGMLTANARRYAWSELDADLLQFAVAKFPDIVPLQRGNPMQEAQRHSWAYRLPSERAYRHRIGKLDCTDRRIARSLYQATRKNARARGHEFMLTEDDVVELIVSSQGRCAVSGITLSTDRGELPAGKKMRRPWAPSIDRVDSTRGYVLGNCRIVCCAANYAMSQWGEEVLIEMAKSIARKRIGRVDREEVGRNREEPAKVPNPPFPTT